MKPEIRDLYKRFLYAARDYPAGKASVINKVKKSFHQNSNLSNEVEIKKAIALGRYWVREIMAVNQLHKYRAMKRRYEN
eukprot:gene10486-11616_t